MKTFWYILYYIWINVRLPLAFLDSLILNYLWDQYWYKHVVPERYGDTYVGFSFSQRCRRAWHKAMYGDA